MGRRNARPEAMRSTCRIQEYSKFSTSDSAVLSVPLMSVLCVRVSRGRVGNGEEGVGGGRGKQGSLLSVTLVTPAQIRYHLSVRFRPTRKRDYIKLCQTRRT